MEPRAGLSPDNHLPVTGGTRPDLAQLLTCTRGEAETVQPPGCYLIVEHTAGPIRGVRVVEKVEPELFNVMTNEVDRDVRLVLIARIRKSLEDFPKGVDPTSMTRHDGLQVLYGWTVA